MNPNDKEKANEEYLKNLLSNDNQKLPVEKENINITYDAPSIEYTNIDLSILPAGRFYKRGTKISIRGAKVSEIQAYSMVDNNFVNITEGMNSLLSKNIKFIYPDGKQGSYKDIKDSDRVFLIFMIRELTFQGGNTLTKETTCNECNNDFVIPFRATSTSFGSATFELHSVNESIEKFFNKEEQVYELLHNGVSWRLGPPTIGIQEDFYDEIKRNVQAEKKPDIAFIKVMPFLLHDRPSITEEGIKAKHKEFKNMDDIILFQGLNSIINKMTVGIKGLKMICPVCGTEVYTDLTFPGEASTLFEIPDILDRFRE
jgi:hypothetical protein